MTQLTLQDAAKETVLKEQGLNDVAEHAEHFVSVMRRVARKISEESGFVSTDNLRVYADQLGIVPHHSNAWGAVFMGKHWKVVSRKQSQYPGNHAREIRVWRYEP
jgi:hypothetical protein